MLELEYKVGTEDSGVKKMKLIKLKKLQLLNKEMEALSETNFTGYVKINFSQGSISRVEKFEEILKDFKKLSKKI